MHAVPRGRLDQIDDLAPPGPRGAPPCRRQAAGQCGEERQMVADPAELGEQDPDVLGAHRRGQAQSALHPDHNPDLGAERGQPVVTVGQHHDLPVVTGLEELLDSAVDVAGHPLARHDDPVGGRQPHGWQPIEGRVVGAKRHLPGLGRGRDDGPEHTPRRRRHGAQGTAPPISSTAARGAGRSGPVSMSRTRIGPRSITSSIEMGPDPRRSRTPQPRASRVQVWGRALGAHLRWVHDRAFRHRRCLRPAR